MAGEKDPGAQGQLVFATTEERAVYQSIKRFYKNNPKAIPTRSYLRLEQVLVNQNRYAFPLLEDQTAQRASEQRLARTDAFHVDQMAFFVGKKVTADPVGSLRLETFANPLVFTGADQASIRTLMESGKFSVEVDQVRFIHSWDIRGSMYVDAAQYLLQQTVTATVGVYGADAFDRAKVFRTMTPTLRLNGGSSNSLQVWVDEPLTAVAPVSTDQNVLVWYMYGWRVANGAEFNPDRRQ